MDAQQPLKQKPLCSIISTLFLVIALILARSVAIKLDQGETLIGYSSLGILTSFLVALILSSLVTGMIALIRGEKPLVFPLLALLSNSVLFFAVILNIPR